MMFTKNLVVESSDDFHRTLRQVPGNVWRKRFPVELRIGRPHAPRMASVYDFKPRFQALLRPLISKLAAWGCTPNTVTSLALFFSLVVGGLTLFARQNPLVLLLLPVWLFLRMALNAIDGMMARELNMKSTLGAVLNEVGDVISDLALYLPLAFVHPPALWPVIAFSFGAEMRGASALAVFSTRLASSNKAARRQPRARPSPGFVIHSRTVRPPSPGTP